MGEIVAEPPWSVRIAEYEQDPLTALVRSQDGVVAGWQARRFLTEKAIRHRVRSGRWQRVWRGVFHTYGGPLTLRQQQWIAVLAVSAGGGWPVLVGGVSALQVHGLRGVAVDRVHVVVPPECYARAPAWAVVHRVRLADEDRHPIARPPATAVARAVVDAAAWARSDDQARLVIAASFQQRLVTEAEIVRVLGRMPVTRRRRLVVLTARDAAGGSHSLGELRLLRICRDADLPLPTRQVKFRDDSGRTRYLDAVFDPWRVAIEIDGAHHEDVAQRWDDAQREVDAILAGWRILRFPVHVVRQQPRTVATRLRKALEAAGWRP